MSNVPKPANPGKRLRLASADEVVIDGTYETWVRDRWALVRVVGERDAEAGCRMFAIVREPYRGNALNPRSWRALRLPARQP